jgi:hypothetical protein
MSGLPREAAAKCGFGFYKARGRTAMDRTAHGGGVGGVTDVVVVVLVKHAKLLVAFLKFVAGEL